MKWDPINRRMFLQGAGGLLLAIPFLPSLLIRSARAASPAQNGVKLRYITILNQHGGIWNQHIYPDRHLGFMQDPESMSMNDQLNAMFSQGVPTTRISDSSIVAGKRVGYDIYADPLAGFVHALSLGAGGQGFSELINAQMTSLLEHMTVIRGLDTTNNAGHHVGMASFGDLGYSDGLPSVASMRNPTIDQIIAYSNAFYPQLPSRRTLYYAFGDGEYGNRKHCRRNSSGAIEEVFPDNFLPINNMSTYFNSLISRRTGTIAGSANTQTRSADPVQVLDSVLEDLTSQLSKASRADRMELQQYIEGFRSVAGNPSLMGLNLSMTQTTGGGTQGEICGPAGMALPSEAPQGMGGLNPTTQAGIDRMLSDMAQLVIALVKCDVTRQINFAVSPILKSAMQIASHQVDFANLDLHQNIYHGGGSGDPVIPTGNGTRRLTNDERQRVNVGSHAKIASVLMRQIIEGLNVPDPLSNNGETYLHNSLVHWTMEHSGTHSTYSLPTILAGRAGGRMKSGQYIDFRRRAAVGGVPNGITTYQGDESGQKVVLGAPINRFWISVMRAMGVPSSEYLANRPSLNNDPSWDGSAPSANAAENTTFRTYSHIFQNPFRRFLLQNLDKPLPFVHPDNVDIDTE